jgi:GPH family glycoside/pentoside/hexuronide:cation symporter
MFGNMIPGIVAPVIIQAFGDTNTLGYTIVGAGCAIVGFIVCFLHYAMTEERVLVGTDTQADDIKIMDIVNVFKSNRPFLALCIHGLCICTMQYASQTLGLYMYSAVYNDLTYQTIGTLLSSPFMVATMVGVPFLCKKHGLEKIIRYSLLIGGGIFGLLFGLHMVIYVHPLVHGVVSGIASGMAMVSIQTQWGLVGEAIDYNEYATGKRTEGSIYGTFNLSRRVGQTIGNSATVLMLGWTGYNADLTIQSATTVSGIKIIAVLLPGIFVLGSWAAFKFLWNMDSETRKKIDEFKKAQKEY